MSVTHALGDLCEIDGAEVLVWLLSGEGIRTAGRAHALGRWVVAVGEARSPFHILPAVTRGPDFMAAVVEIWRARWGKPVGGVYARATHSTACRRS